MHRACAIWKPSSHVANTTPGHYYVSIFNDLGTRLFKRAGASLMTGRLWIDVEDLFEYARENPRPSGIQRLAFEIYSALLTRPGAYEFVRFVRHDTSRKTFHVVSWADVVALF